MLVLGTVYALVFFAFFALGYMSGIKLPPALLATLFLVLSLRDLFVIPILALLTLLAYRMKLNAPRLFAEYVLLVSLLIPVVLYVVVGVPLIENSLRYKLVAPLVLAAILATIGITYSTISFRWKTFLVGVYMLLFFLGTFRSLILLVYLAYFLDTYFRYPQFRRLLLPLSTIPVIVIVAMSGGLEAILIRIGFTFLVFHNLVRLSVPWGLFHGALLFSDNPRAMVASLFGASTHYTYFFFGQAIADFGIFGVVEAFFLGMLLRESEKTLESFVVVLSIMLYALDPGIDAFLLLFILGILLFSSLETH